MTPAPADNHHAEFEVLFRNTLFGAWIEKSRCFDAIKFFNHWFRMQGRPVFFLFKKNLSQSNIQFAELLALVRTHTTRNGDHAIGQELQFHTLNEFIEGFSQMVAAFKGGDGQRACQEIARLYSEPLSRFVLVEPFFGSATVFMPPHLSLNHRCVCAESGYIHSCGPNVFTRSLDLATSKDFVDAIEAYVRQPHHKVKKLFFTVYAHEDFTDYDRAFASELRGGLDEVKIYVEKYHIGNTPLVKILKQLKEKLGDYLVIPEPGDFRRQHAAARKRNDVDRTRTLWLIIDRGVSDTPQVPRNERFVICYDQDIHNGNPFHLFDENKPAWVSHTTIPHTLAGAMLNLTRPWIGHGSSHPVKICDPFGGTGTVWLEAQKFANCHVESRDLEPVTPLLIKDNLKFFSANARTLKNLQRDLRRVIDLLSGERRGNKKLNKQMENAASDLNWTAALYAKLSEHKGKSGSFMAPAVVQAMETEKSVFRRLLLYIALRTRVRHVNQFERGASDDNAAFVKEADTLLRQFEHLLRQRENQAANVHRVGKIDFFQGNYSISCGLSREAMAESLTANTTDVALQVCDACEDRPSAYDVIVTDPPYGMNTEEDEPELADVYARAMRAMVRALRDGGQLVVCLPERSHTGQRLPAFTSSGFVTQQVLTEAEVLNREVIISAQSLPKPGHIFRAPFYWESERALRRTILHFRFREKHNSRNHSHAPATVLQTEQDRPV